MLKLSVIAGVIAITLGATAASTSAFAMGCLDNQDALPAMTLSHNAMVPNAGFEYDKDAYDAAQAKGNVCPTTEQSQPVSSIVTGQRRTNTPTYN